MAKAKVVVLKTNPCAVLDDYRRLLELAEVDKHLDRSATTILKDNISWHLFFPSSNTSPWQLEGTILGLLDKGFHDLVDVHNKTVVTITDKGEKYNKYQPILAKYQIPVKYNFKPEDMSWPVYRPKAPMLVLDKIFPEGILIPDFFIGKNYRDRKRPLSDGSGTPFDAGEYSDIRFEDVLPQTGLKLFYHFDFGDDWIFRLKIGRKIGNAEKEKKYPRLILKNGKTLKQYYD